MAHAKWIGGLFGLLSGGPIGALAGFVLGSLFDVIKEDDPLSSEAGGMTPHDANADRNGFLFSLLALASYVIKADGRIMHSEMELARQFLRQNFGEAALQQGEQIMLRLFEEQKREDAVRPGAYRQTIFNCCQQLAAVLPVEQRVQLLSFLCALAKADGHVASEELNALREITLQMGLSEAELNSMMGLGGNTLADAYAVLEVSPEASDEEVRAAYRRLALKHHPDRVASLGDDVRAAAERKFQQINEARDLIYKSRGL